MEEVSGGGGSSSSSSGGGREGGGGGGGGGWWWWWCWRWWWWWWWWLVVVVVMVLVVLVAYEVREMQWQVTVINIAKVANKRVLSITSGNPMRFTHINRVVCVDVDDRVQLAQRVERHWV
jgi:hypothetical protein